MPTDLIMVLTATGDEMNLIPEHIVALRWSSDIHTDGGEVWLAGGRVIKLQSGESAAVDDDGDPFGGPWLSYVMDRLDECRNRVRRVSMEMSDAD